MMPAPAAAELFRESPAPVAIVAAMPEELAGLRARATHARRVRIDPGSVVEARIGGRRVLLAVTGEGPGRASRVGDALLSRLDVAGLIIAGASGGLCPSLRPGAILMARRVVEWSGAVPEPDSRWLAAALEGANASLGTVLSSPSILSTRGAKLSAQARLGNGEPAAVDLETAALARVAAARGVPYIAVRAVSDTVDENLPLDFDRYRDESGRIDRFRIARVAVSRPGLVGPLWRLRKRVAVCSESLAESICRILERGLP